MEKIGVVKEIDKLGRIVIPKDLRKRYGLQKEVEIIATVDGVLIKSAEYVLTKKE
ncbi:MAG: division/cell wall cluster transcriptional repressor MraZ [Clostridia bacterium]|nr:division/cell wall cluster transcriptional repressor MraZ [Clostridia bacterium]MBP3583977.1 division/cell wall cluster transcriptional repressor MraZ [Clostridia bacterium]